MNMSPILSLSLHHIRRKISDLLASPDRHWSCLTAVCCWLGGFMRACLLKTGDRIHKSAEIKACSKCSRNAKKKQAHTAKPFDSMLIWKTLITVGLNVNICRSLIWCFWTALPSDHLSVKQSNAVKWFLLRFSVDEVSVGSALSLHVAMAVKL